MAITLISDILASSGSPVDPSEVKVRDTMVPNYEIIVRPGIGGSPFAISDNVKQFISEISYEDNVDQFDALIIKLENPIGRNTKNNVTSFLDSRLFLEGNILELKMGYGKALTTVGAAIIVKRTPSFPSDGLPSLTIIGYDLLSRAAKNKPVAGHSYKTSRDSQIAATIGARNGFDINTEDSRSFANIQRVPGLQERADQPKGMNDYKYLKKIADINGFDLFSKFDPEQKKFILFFQPPSLNNNKNVYDFVYNEGDVSYQKTLLSFEPTMDAYNQDSEAVFTIIKGKKSLGSKTKARIEIFNDEAQGKVLRALEAGSANTGLREIPLVSRGDEVSFKAFGQSFSFPKYSRFKTEDQITNAIKQFIKKQRENFITGSGTLMGKEFLQSRQMHNLQGLGHTFSGIYYFTKVIHKMSRNGPYICEFTARKAILDAVIKTSVQGTLSDNDKRVLKAKGQTITSSAEVLNIINIG